MKKFLDAIPAILLLSFSIYVSINPTDLGPICGLVSSIILFGYQQYLSRTDQPDLELELKKIHKELCDKVENSKLESAKELSELKNELAKFSLSMARIPGVVEKPKDRPKIQF